VYVLYVNSIVEPHQFYAASRNFFFVDLPPTPAVKHDNLLKRTKVNIRVGVFKKNLTVLCLIFICIVKIRM
jgi:hypothetical protein